MLILAGLILLGIAFHLGVPAELETRHVDIGQACLFIGTAALTWGVLTTFKAWFGVIFRVGILAIGAIVIAIGVHDLDVFGMAGGVAILAAWGWVVFSTPK